MEFQKGMDLSFIPELEDAGVQVKDFDGTITVSYTHLDVYKRQVDNLCLTYCELISLTAHVFDQDGQMQLTTAGNLEACLLYTSWNWQTIM